MITKTIKYKDYDGNPISEDFLFHFNKAEIIEMEATYPGGIETYINRISAEKDNHKLFAFFKDLVLKSYGRKSLDAKRFEKSEEIRTAFEQTEAYAELVIELMSDSNKAAEFVNGIIPQA